MTFVADCMGAACAMAAFMLLRLYPIWHIRSRGCDAYNILLCAENVRLRRRVPPVIPELFILEEAEQWYPPLFFILAAIPSSGWLQRRFWLFNQLVDLANALLLFVLVDMFAGPLLAAATVITYAALAGLVQEFSVLTTRPLGLFVVNALLLAGFAAGADLRWAPVAIVCGIALIYAHKLSAQQIWFSLPILAAATGDLRWLMLLVAVYVCALVVWPAGFRMIVTGHLAIVRFWHRNWPLLGAHAVKQSPVYGGDADTGYYAGLGHGSAVFYLKQLFHQNYFAVPALTAGALPAAADGLLVFLGWWIVSAYAAALLIHFVPLLRGIGLGQQYVKFSLLPSLLATALTIGNGAPLWYLALAFGALALTARQYWLVARLMRREGTSGQPADALEPLLRLLREDPAARVLVLPVQLCDLVAYASRRPVYWGTHAQVFDERLERFFPVLREPLQHYVDDGALNRLLVDTRYASLIELGLREDDVIGRAGDYVLVTLRPSAQAMARQHAQDALAQ